MVRKQLKEPFVGKRSNWQGLWYSASYHRYYSETFDISELNKYKGQIRITVVKNKYKKDRDDGKPNYVFQIVETNSIVPKEMKVIRDETEHCYRDEEGTRLYTKEEVQECLDRSVDYVLSGFTDNSVEDLITCE